MKIASWNVNSLNVRLPHVLEWLRENPVEMLGIQETKLTDEKFPVDEIKAAGYEVVYSGQKTYNGVAILSKTNISDVVTDVPKLNDPQRRILTATISGIRVINLYVVNGSEVGSEKYAYKLDWLEKVTAYIQTQIKAHEKVVVLGDFNIAPKDEDVYDPDLWRERILCSTPERAALQKIFDLGLVDTFRKFSQEKDSFSWWDYRAAGFRRNQGLRIDLVLASQKLMEVCTASVIDKMPRTWERPSDHAPVWAEFAV